MLNRSLFNDRGLNEKTYAEWKEKKKAQNGYAQTQKAFEKEQTQEKIIHPN